MTKSATYSQSEKLMGSQIPSVRVCPDYTETDGGDCCKVLAVGGLNVDEWQKNTLNDWMSMTSERLWNASTCGLAVPRQNGKTCVVCGRIVGGTVLYGEWIIYTAHLQKTATETFLELRSIFESKGLMKYVKEIKSALGREQIILKNGGRVIFIARTRNGGRGMHGDCLIFDEAQEVTVEQQSSFLPALSASRNPQTIYIGTPPDETCDGSVFRKIRDKARRGESNNIAWSEFSVEEIGDIHDRERWAKCNPALGIRIMESTIASECEQMPPDTFARERLCWWMPIVEHKDEKAIDELKWNACCSEETKPEGKTAYGVKFSPDGQKVTLCGAVITKEGTCRISLISERSTSEGIKWLSDWLNERHQKASCVVIDGKNWVDVLVDKIADTWKFKGSIIRPNSKDLIAGVGMLIDAINEQSLSWYKYQEVLDHSARTSIKRQVGGGFSFGGEDPYPKECCALALFGAKTSKRNPQKKMRIG